MNTVGRFASIQFRYSFAATIVSLASAACSSAGGAPPAVAPSAAATADAPCHPAGPTKVVAKRVFVPAGVEALAQDGSISVRFATAAARCLGIDWASRSAESHPAPCPQMGPGNTVRADTSSETMLAWEQRDNGMPHITLGVVTYDTPHAFFGITTEGQKPLVERTFYAPGNRDGGEEAPELAPIGHDRFLLAWVEGDSESHRLRAQSVVGWGDSLGPSMVLSPTDASVIGRPSVVVGPDGKGLVSYLASVDGEFDAFATPIACAAN